MTSQPLELEGTWEEILAQSAKLAGRRVRVTVLSDEAVKSAEESPFPLSPLFLRVL